MRVLLALLPYVGSTFIYGLNAADLFATAGGKLPSYAAWRLSAPVLVGGGLTPLAVAVDTNREDIDLLVSPIAFAIVYLLLQLALLRDQRRFLRLYRPLVVGGRELSGLTPRRIVVVLGVLVIWYGAAINLVAP
jgi:hypothetical protein